MLKPAQNARASGARNKNMYIFYRSVLQRIMAAAAYKLSPFVRVIAKPPKRIIMLGTNGMVSRRYINTRRADLMTPRPCASMRYFSRPL